MTTAIGTTKMNCAVAIVHSLSRVKKDYVNIVSKKACGDGLQEDSSSYLWIHPQPKI
jgi:hypothetical protein